MKEKLPGRTNHFNLIRVLAAVGVLYSHSFALTGHAEPLIGGRTPGFYCVAVFFSISGFLITKSWLRLPSVTAYLRNRCLRIYPGLWLAVAFTVLVIGPWVTTLRLSDYFLSFRFWAYLVGNSSLLRVVHQLPGVFSESPHQSANGSLWTLPYEVICYAAILAAGVLSRKHPRRFVILIGATLALALAVAFIAALPAGARGIRMPLVVERLAQLLPYFLVGALVTGAATRVRTFAPWLVLGLAGAVALGNPGLLALTLPLTIPPLVIVLAHLPSRVFQRYNQLGDYSYGVYLYAFPIQQVVALWMKDCQPWQNVLYSLPPTLAFAFASWHLLESRALMFARRRAVPRPSDDSPPLPEPFFQP